jgi:hypothetical protein
MNNMKIKKRKVQTILTLSTIITLLTFMSIGSGSIYLGGDKYPIPLNNPDFSDGSNYWTKEPTSGGWGSVVGKFGDGLRLYRSSGSVAMSQAVNPNSFNAMKGQYITFSVLFKSMSSDKDDYVQLEVVYTYQYCQWFGRIYYCSGNIPQYDRTSWQRYQDGPSTTDWNDISLSTFIPSNANSIRFRIKTDDFEPGSDGDYVSVDFDEVGLSISRDASRSNYYGELELNFEVLKNDAYAGGGQYNQLDFIVSLSSKAKSDYYGEFVVLSVDIFVERHIGSDTAGYLVIDDFTMANEKDDNGVGAPDDEEKTFVARLMQAGLIQLGALAAAGIITSGPGSAATVVAFAAGFVLNLFFSGDAQDYYAGGSDKTVGMGNIYHPSHPEMVGVRWASLGYSGAWKYLTGKSNYYLEIFAEVFYACPYGLGGMYVECGSLSTSTYIYI